MATISSPASSLALLALLVAGAHAPAGEAEAPRFVDLSLLVAEGYPCNWPSWPRYQIHPDARIGPLGAYNSEVLTIDGNTGTQLDVPPHSVAPPDSALPNAGPYGRSYTDVVPAWQSCGEACLLDCRDLVDTGAPGESSLVRKERVIAWEKRHRPLGTGDVLLFRSGYTDRYYRPLPEGRRFAAEPLEGKSPAWPDPDPDCMEYLAVRKVMTLGTDSASMGPLPTLAEPTHYAGLKHGMIWAESVTGLGGLPETGAFYCLLSPKYAGAPYAEARAFAVVGDPLARRLIDSARKKNVVDLSVTISEDLPVSWPGRGMNNHRHPYMRIRFGLSPSMKAPFETHMLDSQAGTHLVTPSYALPAPGFDDATYPAEVRGWLAEYEKRHGPRGTSDVTIEQVPIAQSCGPARVIDVRHRIGTVDRGRWPASPEVTVDDIRAYEQRHGALKPGDIAILLTGWSDRTCRPFPEGNACMDDPLNGRSEGWPAPGVDAIAYLASKGIRCVATDAPKLGGVDPEHALMTYWALGGKGMVTVEFLTNLGQVPEGAYFLFAAVKLRGAHGGHGRAIALY